MNCIEKILDLVNKKGITKNKLLTDLKLSKNSFVNWQERNTVPSGETLAKIAEYFNVSTDYLLGTEQKESPLPLLSDKELELLDLFRQMSPEQQAAYVQIMKARK